MNIDKIRADFPVLKETMAGNPLIYFDNSATSLKPQSVIDNMVYYYSKLSTNAHRGDYELSYKVDQIYDGIRIKTAEFINASSKEIIFTSGTTDSINLIANSFFANKLVSGDEIILNYAEHASNVLPWYRIAKKHDLRIVFAPLNDQGELILENIKKVVTSKTRLIALAHVTNTLGDIRDIKNICKFASENNIYTVVDGAQSIPHLKVDVKKLNCDFFAFSAHKMCGPTGIGVAYGKYELLEEMTPNNEGGGMNSRFDNVCNVSYKKVPTIFEAGTPNIAGVFGLGAAIDYINEIGLENIHNYEVELKQYAIEKMAKLDNIEVYNAHTQSGIVLFNIKDVFAQDSAGHLNHYGIAVRAGHHCAKLLHNQINTTVTCRASFYFYNTKTEIDKFVEVLAKGGDYLESIF